MLRNALSRPIATRVVDEQDLALNASLVGCLADTHGDLVDAGHLVKYWDDHRDEGVELARLRDQGQLPKRLSS